MQLKLSAQIKGPFILVQMAAPLLSILSIQHFPFSYVVCLGAFIHEKSLPASA